MERPEQPCQDLVEEDDQEKNTERTDQISEWWERPAGLAVPFVNEIQEHPEIQREASHCKRKPAGDAVCVKRESMTVFGFAGSTSISDKYR